MKILTVPPQMEDSSIVLLARIYTTAGVAAVQNDFVNGTIKLDVYDLEDPANAIASNVNLTPVGTYVFNTLQLDRDWTVNFDTTGYNFAYVTPSIYLPTGNKRFQFQFICDFGSNVKSPFAFIVPTLDLIGR